MAARASVRTRMPRRPIEVRRKQVLDAALQLIEAEGYAAATMEGIARTAGLAKPVVYSAFPNRGELLRALLEREEARALGVLSSAMAAYSAPAEPGSEIVAWWRAFSQAVIDDPTPWRLILMPAEETPEPVREHVRAGREFALGQARTLAEALIAEEPGLASIDVELAARSLFVLAEQAAQLLLQDPVAYPPERLAEFATGILAALRSR